MLAFLLQKGTVMGNRFCPETRHCSGYPFHLRVLFSIKNPETIEISFFVRPFLFDKCVTRMQLFESPVMEKTEREAFRRASVI